MERVKCTALAFLGLLLHVPLEGQVAVVVVGVVVVVEVVVVG